MDTQVRIVINSGVEPFVQSVPRRVAAARKQPLKEELTRMEKLGVIEKIERPTEWCLRALQFRRKRQTQSVYRLHKSQQVSKKRISSVTNVGGSSSGARAV